MSKIYPDNLIESLNYPPPGKCSPCAVPVNKPLEEYNKQGQLIGYSWHQGDTVQLHFHIDGEIFVEDDAIVYTSYGDAPTSITEGTLGQKAYNIVDSISWTCTAVQTDNYTWTRDRYFENPETSGKSFFISAKEYLKNKLIRFRILDFRKNIVFESKQDAETDLYFDIDKETSEKLFPGTYYVNILCFSSDEVECMSLISGEQCQLFVR